MTDARERVARAISMEIGTPWDGTSNPLDCVTDAAIASIREQLEEVTPEMEWAANRVLNARGTTRDAVAAAIAASPLFKGAGK